MSKVRKVDSTGLRHLGTYQEDSCTVGIGVASGDDIIEFVVDCKVFSALSMDEPSEECKLEVFSTGIGAISDSFVFTLEISHDIRVILRVDDVNRLHWSVSSSPLFLRVYIICCWLNRQDLQQKVR
jgi:hypothetical protein